MGRQTLMEWHAGGPAREGNAPVERLIPPTRYQGSKRKLCDWIRSCLAPLEFHSALDGFGGTGSVAYLLKAMGKRVTYNDILHGNEQIGIALIENDRVLLSDEAVDRLIGEDGAAGGQGEAGECGHDVVGGQARVGDPATFIADTFGGIYFTDAENAWLDRVCRRIRREPDRHQRALAWYALFQSAIAKRPYNLFHRKNLYMRTADVKRSFGNKATWDKPFADHFRDFAHEANAAIVDGAGACVAVRGDVLDVAGAFDLVYIDPPYINGRGTGVDYGHFYHFLEGLLDYDNWPSRIDWKSKHRRLRMPPTPWNDRKAIHAAFAAVFERFRDSILVVSYRGDGVPTIAELAEMLRRHKRRVEVCARPGYQYALSTNRDSNEVLLIGT